MFANKENNGEIIFPAPVQTLQRKVLICVNQNGENIQNENENLMHNV